MIASLGAGLGVSWPRRSATTEIEIERFLAAELRHHVTSPDALAARAEIVDWVKDTYAALVRLSQMPEHHPSRTRLNRVRAEFDKASSVLGSRWRKPNTISPSANSERAQLLSHAAMLEQRVAAQSDVATNQAAQLAAAIEEMRQSQEERDVQYSRHLLIEAELDNLRSVLHETQSKLSAERQKVAQQSDHIADLDRVRMVAEAKHNEVSERVRQLHAEVSTHARIAAEQSALLGSLQLARDRYEEQISLLVQRQRELEALLYHERRTVDDLNTRLADETSTLVLKTQEAEQTASALALKDQEAKQTASALALKNQEAEQTASALALKIQEVELTASALALKNQVAERTAAALALKVQEVEQTASTLARKSRKQSGRHRIRQRRRNRQRRSCRNCAGINWSFHRNWPATGYSTSGLSPCSNSEGISGLYESRIADDQAFIRMADNGAVAKPAKQISKAVEVDLMRRSELFDAGWYLTEYPDVRKSSVEPAEHYWGQGWLDGPRSIAVF